MLFGLCALGRCGFLLLFFLFLLKFKPLHDVLKCLNFVRVLEGLQLDFDHVHNLVFPAFFIEH